MQPELIRLCYTSRACLAERGAGVRQITDILGESQSWNRQVGITGALFFNRGQFAQALEGPPEAVENIFGSISRDDRHEKVIRLDLRAIDSRCFGDWSMCFVGTESEGLADFGALHPYRPSRPNLVLDAMLDLLRSLVTRWEHTTPEVRCATAGLRSALGD